MSFYLENSSLKISSGANFQTDWITFESHLVKNLILLNIESTYKKEVNTLPSKMVQFELLSGFEMLFFFLNRSLHSCLNLFLKNYADNEIIATIIIPTGR